MSDGRGRRDKTKLLVSDEETRRRERASDGVRWGASCGFICIGVPPTVERCKAVSINSHSLCRSLTHLHSWLHVHHCGTNLMRTVYRLQHDSGLNGVSSYFSPPSSWTVALWGHNKAARSLKMQQSQEELEDACRCHYQVWKPNQTAHFIHLISFNLFICSDNKST